MYGIDVSAHQGAIDWSAVQQAGVEFAFIRSSYGGAPEDLDTQYVANLAGARQAGLLVGHYHFAYPTGDDAPDEASHFLRTADLRLGEPIALDVETDSLGLNPDLEPRLLAEWVLQYSEVIRRETDRGLVVYTTPGFAAARMAALPALEALPLWLAHVDVDEPSIPAVWTEPWCWQYSWTGSVDGITGDVDENRFYGSADDWLAAGSPVEAVEEVQQLLSTVLYPIAVDGIVGPETRAAVQRFQQGYAVEQLTVDGIVGPETRAAVRRCHAEGGRAAPNFTFAEFACGCRQAGFGGEPGFCNGQVWIDRRIVLVAQDLRERIGPFSPVAACRCEAYHERVADDDHPPHHEGTAIDVLQDGEVRHVDLG